MPHTPLPAHSLRIRRASTLSVTATAACLALVAGCGSSGSGTGAPVGETSRSVATSATISPPSRPAADPTVGPTDPAQTPGPAPAVIDLQVVKQDGATIVIAPVVIKGRTYSFVVDTGATVTLISSTFAKQIGLKQTTAESVPLAGIGGQSKAYLANISDWRIGRAKVPTSTVAVADLTLRGGLVGLLGSDVLSTFGKVTIDYKAEKATLG